MLGKAYGWHTGAGLLQSFLKSLNMADREMLSRYMALSMAERKTVRDVVEALSVASVSKRENKK